MTTKNPEVRRVQAIPHLVVEREAGRVADGEGARRAEGERGAERERAVDERLGKGVPPHRHVTVQREHAAEGVDAALDEGELRHALIEAAA